jgi:hypothetical protein
MRENYRMLLDDGTQCVIESDCAANAIQIALIKNPGRCVTKCWKGGLADGTGLIKQIGRIDFDVPPHKALTPEEAQAAKRRRNLKAMEAATPTMDFGMDLRAESKKARIRADEALAHETRKLSATTTNSQ